MENSENSTELESTPGKRLREAREALGMSPREMADRLNWLPSHVAAIEEDDFDQLRGAAFVRGYLRAYARAVNLDEDEMVALFVALHPEAREPATQAASAPPPSAPSQKTGMSVVLGVVVAMVVIGAIWWKQQRAEQSPGPAAAAAGSTTSKTTPAAATQTAVRAEAPADSAVDDAAAAVVDVADDVSAEVAVADSADIDQAASSDDEVAAAAEYAAGAATVVDAGLDQADNLGTAADNAAISADGPLQFSFSGDCWLEVRDGEGQLIYADLKRAGDTLGLDGIPPFEILAGDAAAVSLRYRGEPVALRTRPGRDTARLTVGEQ